MLLSETHVTEDYQASEIYIDGYDSICTYSKSRYTGGVLIYIKKTLKYKEKLNRDFDMNMWIAGIEVKIQRNRCLLYCLYHSPSSSDIQFLNNFEELLENHIEKDGQLIIMGDYNINYGRNEYYSRKLKTIIERQGLYQLVNEFTRVTKNTSTVIDLIVTNDKQLKFEIHTTPRLSDHFLIEVELTSKEENRTIQKLSRNYKTFKDHEFQIELMDTEWEGNCSNLEVLSQNLVDGILSTLDKHAPLEQKNIRQKLGNMLWFTREIGQEILKRDRQYKVAIVTKSAADWENFRRQRNRVVGLIRKQKQKYYSEKVDEVKNRPTEMWKTLKQLLQNKKGGDLNDGIVFDNKLVTDSQEIAENFNNYFLESIEDILDVQEQGEDYSTTVNLIETPECSMQSFKLLEMRDLRRIVKQMKVKKNSVDGIDTRILKLAFETIGNRFLQVINLSTEKGQFPKSWKISTVIPVEKKSNTNQSNEFRPINMVPVYEKLLELVVHGQMVEYIEKNNILSEFQAGFRSGNSCETALQTVIMNWKDAMEHKQMVGVLFLDFRRAFETIDRRLLLMKLGRYGFGPIVLQWFEDYFSDRKQRTKYGGCYSSERGTVYGVPQGTTLGPTLFVLYINDIVKVIKKCNIQLFADDTVIYVRGNSVDEIIDVISEEIINLLRWLGVNSLRLNPNKTKLMIIKSRYNNTDTKNHRDIKIDDQIIEQVEEIKYLGVLIDENLEFSKHANYVTGKISKKVNVLRRVGRDLTVWARLAIYRTIILPHFIFCSTLLFLIKKGEIEIMQKKQNQAMRCILSCDRYTRISDMLQTTKWLSVNQTIVLNSMVFIYKMLNGMIPKHLIKGCRFVKDIHDYDTRSRDNFYIPRVSNTYSQNNLFFKGLRQYNSLPIEVKCTESLGQFKRNCREYVRECVDI